MPIASAVKDTISSPGASVIRKMFEEGLRLKAQYGAENVFDFSLGNPDLDPPGKIRSVIKKVAKLKEKNKHGYMPNAGYDFCRQAMADKTGKEQGIHLSEDCVVMSVGAAGALNSLLKAILNPGDQVIVPSPFFAEYRHYVRNYSGILTEVPTKEDFSLDIDAIRNALTGKTTAVLINSPNNPTGRIYSMDELIQLGKVLEEHAAKGNKKPYLILDEPYRAITYDGATVPAAFPIYESSVVVTSFAKNLSLPGERIGYICVNPYCPDKDELVAACIFTTRVLGYVNAPGFMQRVVAQCWDVPCDYSLYEKRRNMLMKILDKAGIKYCRPEGAFYLWCKVPDSYQDDDMAFTEYLKRYFILSAPGSGFGGKGWFRLAYCVSQKCIENSEKAFVQAMADLNK